MSYMDSQMTLTQELLVCAFGCKISSPLGRCVVSVHLAHGTSFCANPQDNAIADQGASAVWTFSSFPKSSHKSHHTAEPTWEPQTGAHLAPGDITTLDEEWVIYFMMGRTWMLEDRGVLAAGSLWKSSPLNSLQQCKAENSPP